MLETLTAEELRFLEAREPEILVESWSNSARTVQIRGFTIDGTFSFDHTTNSNRSRATDTFRLPGLPVHLQASPSAAPVRRGELYVRISLRLGGFPVGRLISGYLTDVRISTWPPGVDEPFVSGRGLPRVITGTDPAAGSEISETVPTNVAWRLIGFRFTLVTDATVANRNVRVIIDDGTTECVRIPPNFNHAASITANYFAGVGLGVIGWMTGAVGVMPLPVDLILFQGWRIRTNTLNLQAGDNFRAPVLYVEEWIQE